MFDIIFLFLCLSAIFESYGDLFQIYFGSFFVSLQPYYIILLIIVISFFPLIIKTFKTKNNILNIPIEYKLFFSFALWSIASAFIMPFIFSSTPVFIPRLGIDDQVIHQNPLVFTFSNVGQAGYLLLNTLFVFALIAFRFSISEKKLTKYFLWTIGIAVSIALIQQIIYYSTGLCGLFEEQSGVMVKSSDFCVFNCDKTQRYGELLRSASTFMEPSVAGAFLASASIFLISKIIFQKFSKTFLLMGWLTMLALLFTTSMLGYASFGVMLIILLGFSYATIDKSIFFQKLKIVLTMLVSVVAVYWLITSSTSSTSSTIKELTVEKTQHVSFSNRITADLFALKLTVETYGVGVGLGSNRPSSFITSILSNLGIVGFILSTSFVLMLIYKAFKIPNQDKSFLFAFITILIAMSMGIPDLSFPSFWVLLFIIILLNNQFYDKRDGQNADR